MPEITPNPLFQMGDLIGLKEPLTKLIETIGLGFGRASDAISRIANAYWLANKDANNEAERIQLVEAARTKVLLDRTKMLAAFSMGGYQQMKSLDIEGTEVSAHFTGVPAAFASLSERANNLAAYQNALHLLNVDSIVANAAVALVGEPEVSAEPVDQDWVARLFDIVKDISSEEMQVLWGNILAGEIKQPGSYTLRTLEVLRNLTQREAQLFRMAANFTIRSEKNCMIGLGRYGYNQMVSSNYGFDFENLRELIDCGLISPNNYNIAVTTEHSMTPNQAFRIGNQILMVSSETSISTHYNVHPYTKAGNELYSLVCSAALLPIAFLTEFTEPMRTEGMRTFYARPVGELENGAFVHEDSMIEITSAAPEPTS